MTQPFHLHGHEQSGHAERGDNIRMTPKTDLQWGRPLFRAPALVSPQRIEDLKFDVEFRAKDRARH
ncbi:hypothetical protein GALL_96600 [mine drainage metagenome]|uniref:Uncharacterized protein n=1 Tax=mine drainage metagenome TaxID=410659 RepID=A0A1J5SI87_9ZZZZ